MSMQDPIADMLTRIRNAQMANMPSVIIPHSNMKARILEVLKQEGFIKNYEVNSESLESEVQKEIVVALKYFEGRPVITRIKRVSKPSLRVYSQKQKLGRVPGFGIKVLTTSKGVVSDRVAKQLNVGGEILCEVA